MIEQPWVKLSLDRGTPFAHSRPCCRRPEPPSPPTPLAPSPAFPSAWRSFQFSSWWLAGYGAANSVQWLILLYLQTTSTKAVIEELKEKGPVTCTSVGEAWIFSCTCNGHMLLICVSIVDLVGMQALQHNARQPFLSVIFDNADRFRDAAFEVVLPNYLEEIANRRSIEA
ncbi:hypothetical protein F5Y08DRAFT_310699 [Xylaria arbuscula]|nr:hypothetical protein F5Y08DRAFT_310699 [Xylaria arbuscula]